MRTSLVVALVVLGVGCTDPGKDKPKATVSTPVAKPDEAKKVEPLANATAFPFTQDGSKVSFVGAKITGKHDGGFKTFGGIVEVVDGDLSKSRVSTEIDMKSVFTDAEKLTGHLQSPDFFDVEKFPTAKFVSSAIKKLEGEGKFEVTGELTLHGVTKTITFPATIVQTGDELSVASEFVINRKDFSIVYPGKPDDLIADNVALVLDIHAKKRAG